ncbi:hypothetical protein Tco_0371538 [Tanacetum coccineum]
MELVPDMSMCLESEGGWTLLQHRSNSTLLLSTHKHPDMAMYSASVVDIAVLRCFFDDQLTNLSQETETSRRTSSENLDIPHESASA